MDVSLSSPAVAPGLVFVAPFEITGSTSAGHGALILDNRGEPVWFKPETQTTVMNLRVQHYRGAPVLTWYEGDVLGGYGGEFVIADASYRELTRVRAAHGQHGDLHEFVLTSRGTALISIYALVPADLTSVGGTTAGSVTEGVIQELDVQTGEVLFEWHSSRHVGLDESYLPSVKNDVADYFHLNSIGVDGDGDLLVSARNTSTVYKLDRRTGAIRWRLGGKRTDFTLVPGSEFAFQHDVRRHADGTLTIFANDAAAPTATTPARPIRIALDETTKTVRLVAEYRPPVPRVTWAMGNIQQLADGGVFVGWGTAGSYTEFAPDGSVRYDATLGDGTVSYRAFREPWVGRPAQPPALAVTRDASGSATAHVSWNGATEVARWRADAGARRGSLRPAATVRRTGFETALPLGARHGFIAVTALDAHGRALASTPVRPF